MQDKGAWRAAQVQGFILGPFNQQVFMGLSGVGQHKEPGSKKAPRKAEGERGGAP